VNKVGDYENMVDDVIGRLRLED